jgi:hypothetical protein
METIELWSCNFEKLFHQENKVSLPKMTQFLVHSDSPPACPALCRTEKQGNPFLGGASVAPGGAARELLAASFL